MLELLSKIIGYNIFLKINVLRNKLFTLSINRKFIKNNQMKFQFPSRIEGMDRIEIGNNFSAAAGLRLQAIKKYKTQTFNPSISIGNNVTINPNCQIVCVNEIIIEDNVLLASYVFISDHSHGINDGSDILLSPENRKLFSKGRVVIGANTWIGQGVCILSGVKIGKNVIVGANSVVTKDVPDNSIIAGIPAKVIKEISNEGIF